MPSETKLSVGACLCWAPLSSHRTQNWAHYLYFVSAAHRSRCCKQYANAPRTQTHKHHHAKTLDGDDRTAPEGSVFCAASGGQLWSLVWLRAPEVESLCLEEQTSHISNCLPCLKTAYVRIKHIRDNQLTLMSADYRLRSLTVEPLDVTHGSLKSQNEAQSGWYPPAGTVPKVKKTNSVLSSTLCVFLQSSVSPAAVCRLMLTASLGVPKQPPPSLRSDLLVQLTAQYESRISISELRCQHHKYDREMKLTSVSCGDLSLKVATPLINWPLEELQFLVPAHWFQFSGLCLDKGNIFSNDLAALFNFLTACCDESYAHCSASETIYNNVDVQM